MSKSGGVHDNLDISSAGGVFYFPWKRDLTVHGHDGAKLISSTSHRVTYGTTNSNTVLNNKRTLVGSLLVLHAFDAIDEAW